MLIQYSEDDRKTNARDVLHRPGGVEKASRSIRRGFTPSPSVTGTDASSSDDSDDEDSTMPVTVEFHDDNDGSITLVKVPEGTKITEAATKAGVFIPTVRQLFGGFASDARTSVRSGNNPFRFPYFCQGDYLLTEPLHLDNIPILQLCHHPRLPPAGKCGVCVVAVENGPYVKKFVESSYAWLIATHLLTSEKYVLHIDAELRHSSHVLPFAE
eukprot:scaffold2987_cov170-Amphora_coffeaeformis.AAC.37